VHLKSRQAQQIIEFEEQHEGVMPQNKI